jgi:hypothetical protein
MSSWNILENPRIWRIKMPPTDKMTLLVQALDKEEFKKYFILLQNLDYNEDSRLESSKDDQYSHMKILQNGKSNIINNLKEQFNENIYLILANSA